MLALALGADYVNGVGGVLVLLLVAALLAAIFASFSNGIAILTGQRETLIGAVSLLLLPLTFLSGALMQLSLAPGWIGTVAKFNPVDWAATAARNATTESFDWGVVAGRVGLLAALVVAGRLVRHPRLHRVPALALSQPKESAASVAARMATCYRHPSRETGVSCSNCGNPICPDCMTPTPVGMRCPDCSKQKTPTRSLQSLAVEPIATYVLIALNVLIFFGVQARPATVRRLVAVRLRASTTGGPLHGVAEGEYWRLVTSGLPARGVLAHRPEHAGAVLARADDRAGARPRALRRRSTSRRCSPARWA